MSHAKWHPVDTKNWWEKLISFQFYMISLIHIFTAWQKVADDLEFENG